MCVIASEAKQSHETATGTASPRDGRRAEGAPIFVIPKKRFSFVILRERKRPKNPLMDPSPTAQDDGKKLRLRMTERGVDPFAFGSGQALRYAQDDDLPPVILRERSD